MKSSFRAKNMVLLGFAGAVASAAWGQGSFHVMPFVPGAPTVLTTAISADGTVVAGHIDGSVNGGTGVFNQCFRYTIAGGYEGTGDLPGARVESFTGGLSPDGVWVFGNGTDGGSFRQPIRWSAATGIQALALHADGVGGHANASSFDGSVIVGIERTGSLGSRVVLWRQGVVESISPLSGNANGRGITPDGAFVTGTYRFGGDWAYRWSAAGGLEMLPPPAGASGSDGLTISNDGSVVMGRVWVGSLNHYLRWTAAGGSVVVPDLPGRGRALTSMNDMNADGSVAVGQSLAFGTVPEIAVIWDAEHGVRDLNAVASGLGIDLSGYHLNWAIGISDDGLVITGVGNRPNFANRGFILRLPGPACYANCDGSTAPAVLNVSDFVCFLNRFAAGDAYANCDGSTTAPVLNILDFECFLNRFGAGCP